MDDRQIVALYWERSEDAIAESAKKYGGYCTAIANRILHSPEDTEECVNDTWVRAWNAIPPERPSRLELFLGTITRNLALDRFRKKQRQKAGRGEVPLCLDELLECVGDWEADPENRIALQDAMNRFLDTLTPDARVIFMLRYWHFLEIREIAQARGMSTGAVKMSLSRTRAALKEFLTKEEIEF